MKKSVRPSEDLARAIHELQTGEKKHASLADASLYAMFNEAPEVSRFIDNNERERCRLVWSLTREHLRSAGTLFPGLTTESELAAFEAIEELAIRNPDQHPTLKAISELEKCKHLAGANGPASRTN